MSTLPRERPVRLSRAVQHWVCSLPREQRRRLLARLGDLGELDRVVREPGLCPAPPVVPPVGGGR